MQGRGVTTYNVEEPSFAFSTATTEFDDELIRRGIQTFEQAMMRKGASEAQAKRLAECNKEQQQQSSSSSSPAVVESNVGKHPSADSDDDATDSDDDDDDDAFLRRYRAQRLRELQQEQQQAATATTTLCFGQVIPISRPEWQHHVNDASRDGRTWVVVTLTSSTNGYYHRTANMERAVQVLAGKFETVKFVKIDSKAAFEEEKEWPEEYLPTILLYRYGTLQEQLIGLPVDVTAEELEWTLAKHGVLETSLKEDPSLVAKQKKKKKNMVIQGYRGSTSSRFGGTVAQFATQRMSDDDDDDEFL